MNFIIPYKHKTRTIKLLEENIVCSLILVLTIFFWICLRQGKQKQKKPQMGLHQTKKLLYREGNYQQNEKAVY